MTKCPCCGQKSRLRRVECTCGNAAYQSRKQIAAGLMACPCGGTLDPACLLDRELIGGEYGREAWAEFAWKHQTRPDPHYSAIAAKGAATRAFRNACAAVPVASDPIPF